MTHQVITIGADGSMSGLQRKPGQGLDLRQFGRAHIERASEIVWDEMAQRWQVSIFSGRVFNENGLQLTGTYLTHRMWLAGARLNPNTLAEIGGEMGGDERNDPDAPVDFQDYDAAVRAEIAYLDALRLAGYLV